MTSHPFRERLRGALMLAMHRSGRRAEALAVHRAGQDLLAEELGLDPGAALRERQQAILTDDPSLQAHASPAAASTPPVVQPAQLPADIADFTGRVKQVALVHDLLLDDRPDRPSAVVVSAIAGKAGVGKTALAVHVGHRVRGRFGDGQLYVDLRGAEPHPADPAEVLDRFVCAMSAPGAAVPDVAEERAALLDVPQARAEELLDALVDAQLLEVSPVDATGQTRYRFHDLIRLYAGELAGAEEPEPARTAALERAASGWFALAEQAEARLPTIGFELVHEIPPGWRPEPNVAEALLGDPLAWFEAERLNLGAAVEAACAGGLDLLACHLGRALRPFLALRAYYDDWRTIDELGIGAARRARDRRAEGNAIRGLGELAQLHEQHDAALALFEQAHATFAAVGDRQGQAFVISGVGAVHRDAGRLDEALAALEQALAGLRTVGDRHNEVVTLRRLAGVHQMQGRLEQAAERFQQALAVLGELSEPVAEASVLEGLGVVHTRQGRRTGGPVLLDRSLALHRRHGNRYGVARALGSLGVLDRAEARPGPAIDRLGEALRIWTELRLPWWQARTLHRIGTVHADAGAAAARGAWREAQRLFAALHAPEADELAALLDRADPSAQSSSPDTV